MNCSKRNAKGKKQFNVFRRKCRNYFREKSVPHFHNCIKYSQQDFKSINNYLNRWPDAYFDKYVYQGAKKDFRLNCSTRYMKELNEIQYKEMVKDITILLYSKDNHTSRIAILHNYIINSKDSSKLGQEIITEIFNAENRFTMMLILRDNSANYAEVKSIMEKVLSNISSVEKRYLWGYILNILSDNGNSLDNPKISNVSKLIGDFYELWNRL